jgi:hypothetical protein
MRSQPTPQLRTLEGHQVNVAFHDGSRIDDCQLISAGRPGTDTVWLFTQGMDVFLPTATIVDCWETPPPPNRCAA